MSAPLPCIAITTGEPAGIGPEVSLDAAVRSNAAGAVRCVLVGDGRLLEARARAAGIAVALVPYRRDRGPEPGTVEVEDVPLAVPCVPGRLDAANGRAVLATIDRAIDGASLGEFGAIVTAPVQKSAIADAGVPFIGHTEHLAERTGARRVVMMLAGRRASAIRDVDADRDGPMLRVALVTTHLPLARVAAAVTESAVLETLRIVHADLRDKFGIAAPRVLVTGLNPHAGESGHLGREEMDVIAPALAAARSEGIDAQGPFPADTLFQPRYLDDCDAVVAMYHDQGLPVLKFATFGRGVNITLGLPIVRTSADHGTALDIAARADRMDLIDTGSMRTAVDVAASMCAAGRVAAAG